MELHHKLRRDPSWHPNACNICGQLGHQAAQCNVGTVNWQKMYGENAFRIQRAIFQSDIDAAKKAKQIDFAELEKRACEYAKMREEASKKQLQPVQLPVMQGLPPAAAVAAPAAAATTAADVDMVDGGAAPAAAAAAPAAKPEAEGLPEGWAVAYDAQKRPYYWHRKTKRVTWEKPTEETPIT